MGYKPVADMVDSVLIRNIIDLISPFPYLLYHVMVDNKLMIYFVDQTISSQPLTFVEENGFYSFFTTSDSEFGVHLEGKDTYLIVPSPDNLKLSTQSLGKIYEMGYEVCYPDARDLYVYYNREDIMRLYTIENIIND